MIIIYVRTRYKMHSSENDQVNVMLILMFALKFNTLRMLMLNEPRHEISNNVVCATSTGSDQPALTHSLIRACASRLIIL